MDNDKALNNKIDLFLRGANRQILFDVGDTVEFSAGSRGIIRGEVEKLNPTRAVVRTPSALWDVQYEALMNLNANAKSRPAERGRRLLEVAEQARELMDKHGLKDWRLEFNNARRQLGACRMSKKLITLSRRHALKQPPDLMTDVILHEIAHALAGPGVGHGPKWKAIASRLGARPRSCAPEPEEMKKKLEAAKAIVKVGDKVTFEYEDKTQTGLIKRKNPKRATVACSEFDFLVPYSWLKVVQRQEFDSEEA